jgi:hypothetical protein
MRSLTKLTVVAFAGLTLSAAAAYAQTTQSPANCGIETWSAADQKYVTTPCVGGGAVSGQPANAPGSAASNCGIETYSQAEQKYVTMPCVGGTTYENPTGKASENPNSK